MRRAIEAYRGGHTITTLSARKKTKGPRIEAVEPEDLDEQDADGDDSGEAVDEENLSATVRRLPRKSGGRGCRRTPSDWSVSLPSAPSDGDDGGDAVPELLPPLKFRAGFYCRELD